MEIGRKKRLRFWEREGGEKLTRTRVWSVVDEAAGDNGSISADAESDAGERGRAGVDVSAGVGAVKSTGDSGVVGRDDGGGEVEEGRSRVGNGQERLGAGTGG